MPVMSLREVCKPPGVMCWREREGEGGSVDREKGERKLFHPALF